MNENEIIKKIVDHIHIDENNLRYGDLHTIERFLNGEAVTFQRWISKKLIQNKQLLEFLSFFEQELKIEIIWNYDSRSKSNYTAESSIHITIDLEEEFRMKELGIGLYRRK